MNITVSSDSFPQDADMDTSNESGSKGGDYSITPEAQAMVIPTPPLSTSSSRAGSMTTNRPSSEQVSESFPTNDSDPFINPTPGPSSQSPTFHSNIATAKDPKHVLVKATKDLIQVKILTFKAYNIDDIVRCFFDEKIESDDPGASLDSTLESVVSSPSSTPDPQAVKNILSKFLNSSLQVFYKTSPPMTPDDTPEEPITVHPSLENPEPMEQEEGEEDKEEEEEGNAI